MDGDVIAHEYGHGVSSRLVGGGTLGYNGGDQRGALGEGWSDVISYLKWGDAVVGEYVTGNATTGIRSVAYDNSNLTFQDYNTNSGSGHGNGQIWASAVYDIRAQFPGGVEPMATLVLDAMKATPANPTFIDARNGLLTADGGANTCLIWSAFAGRGLGVDSTDRARHGSDGERRPSRRSAEPTADAGGPYVTPEGTDVALDGTGSASGSDPSAGAITGLRVGSRRRRAVRRRHRPDPVVHDGRPGRRVHDRTRGDRRVRQHRDRREHRHGDQRRADGRDRRDHADRRVRHGDRSRAR